MSPLKLLKKDICQAKPDEWAELMDYNRFFLKLTTQQYDVPEHKEIRF